MLLSQSFLEVTKTSVSLHQLTNNDRKADSASKNNFPRSFMSVSSFSSSSSPSGLSTPPDPKQHSNLESCDNANLPKSDADSFPIEQLFSKQETEGESRPPRTESCPNGFCTNMQPPAGLNNSNCNGSYAAYSQTDNYNKFFEQRVQFEMQPSSNLSHQNTPFSRTNSQDLATTEQLLPQQQSASATRKSYENITDKELRKKLKNRESAQAARDRKKAKMLSLERQVSELHERYRLVETENQELRIRIQRMEANAYWKRLEKHENGIASNQPGLLPLSFSGVGSNHGATAVEPPPYNRANNYPAICVMGDYEQQSSHCITSPEPADEVSLPPYNPISLDGAAEFQSANYQQTLWNGDNLPSLQSSQHPTNYSVGDPGTYSDNGNMLG